MYRILLVEDDKLLATVLKDFFEAGGVFRVLHAADGEEAIALYEKECPHLLLLDIVLPKKNGFEVIAEIQKSNSYMPIILMTGTEVRTESEVKGYQLGAVNYLKKPVIPQAVLAQIETLLHLSHGVESYTVGNYHITVQSQLVKINDVPFKLREKDIQVLSVLLGNQNSVVTRSHILRMVWQGDRYEMNNALDSAVSRIRKALHPYPGVIIEPIYAEGYILRKKS